MLACLLLLSASALGVAMAIRLSPPLHAGCRLGLGLALGQALLAWVPFVFAAALNLGAHDAGLAATALLGLLSVAAYTTLERSSVYAQPSPRTWLAQCLRGLRAPGMRGPLLVGGAFVGLFGWLVHTRYLRPGDGGLLSGGVTWGDLPMHLGLVTRFLYADGLPVLEHPLYLHGPLVYPFLPDYDVAVLTALGVSLHWAFILSGTLAFVSLVLIVHALACFWLDTDAPLPTALAVWLFFLAGGLGVMFFAAQVWQGGEPLALLRRLNFTYLEDDSILKAGHIGNLFLAARTATPGMAIGGAAVLLLGHAREASAPTRGHLLLTGFLAGSLPLIHGHSFIAVCAVAASYALLARPRDTRFFWVLAMLALAALPQLAWLHHTASGRTFVHIAPGFLRPAASVTQWLLDLTLGLGLWAVLVPVSFVAASARTRRLTLPLLALLPLVNVVTFTPTVYDNIKLVAWFDLAAAVLLAGYLAGFVQTPNRGGFTRRARVLLAALAITACTASGSLAVTHELLDGPIAISTRALRLVDFVNAHTAPSAIIATGASERDALAMLSGRRVLVAAPYMLGTHGIDVRERARDLVGLYAGGERGREIAARLGVTAVLVGPLERKTMPVVNEAWLASVARAQYTSEDWRLFVLR